MRKIYQKACKISLIIVALFTVQIGHTDPINTTAPNWRCTLQSRIGLGVGGCGVAGYYAITPNIDLSTGLLYYFKTITDYGHYEDAENGGFAYSTYKLKLVSTHNITIPLIARFHRHKKENWGLSIGLNFDFIVSGEVDEFEIICLKENNHGINLKDIAGCSSSIIKNRKGSKDLSKINNASKFVTSIFVGSDYKFEGGHSLGVNILYWLNSAIPLNNSTYSMLDSIIFCGKMNIGLIFSYNLIPLFTK